MSGVYDLVCQLRVPDAVVCPDNEEEVVSVLRMCQEKGFAVIPVGGRTNVTSATLCPSVDVDPRPFVAVDMRSMARLRRVSREDSVALIEAGMSGADVVSCLAKENVTMGMEPDSMEFSTLGGWIATHASGMKRGRYGNIEDMVVEVLGQNTRPSCP